MTPYDLTCPNCGTESSVLLTNLGVGSTSRLCPQCLREFRIRFKGGAVVEVRPWTSASDRPPERPPEVPAA